MADPKEAEIKENKAPESNPPTEKKGKKRWVIAVGGLFFLIFGAISSIYFFAPSLLPASLTPFKEDRSPEEKKIEPAKQGHIYSLESMLVNLADAEIPRYLKIKIDIESENAKPDGEFDRRLPQLKDAILTILTSKTYPDISEAKGKLNLKEEIVQKANQLFETFKVKTVYFTEFVVQ